MVYNDRDLLVMTQDANLRAQAKWMYTVYDQLNRPVATGIIDDAHDRAYHASLAASSLTYPDGLYNYIILTHTLYDDYSWVSTLGDSFTASRNTADDGKFLPASGAFPFPQALTQSSAVRGQVTGMRIAVLGGSSGMLYRVNYYDDRGRVIQTQQTNITGGTDITTTQYDFSGKPLRTLLKQEKAGTNAQTHSVLTKMNYDAAGRLLTLYKNIDNAPSDQLISTNTYNELGQLQNKELGNNLDNLAYAYNIRGWLTSINKGFLAGTPGNYFGMELAYDKQTSAAPNASYAAAQFNGNITGTIWKTAGDGVGRKYDFTYDNANRLTGADFNQDAGGAYNRTAGLDFSVSNLAYDGNGNILSMDQKGFKVGGSVPIDQLAYSYLPN